ncbi:hypothetical protein QFZ76_000848 [Streptomyces sp. V4I2]|nr:hypothetical protein [Streptomyces sp. V4I2]
MPEEHALMQWAMTMLMRRRPARLTAALAAASAERP